MAALRCFLTQPVPWLPRADIVFDLGRLTFVEDAGWRRRGGGRGALGTGLEHRIILLDGAHLMRMLTGAVALPDLLRLAARHLEQYGEPLLAHKRLAELS